MKLLLLLACGLLCHGRENVIFEQIGEMAGSTSYLHAHITINLTAIHHQIAEYRKALLTHFENRETVSKFINDSLPANQSNPYVMEYAAHQWTIIARLHERDLIDIEEHALSLRNTLPDVPESPAARNRILHPSTRRPRNLPSPDVWKVPPTTFRTSTPSTTSTTSTPKNKKKTDQTDRNIAQLSREYKTYSSTIPESVYIPMPVRKKRFIGFVALPLAVAATAMGIYNTAQIEFLKTELVGIQENNKRLFEVVSNHDQEIQQINSAIRGLADVLTGTMTSNPAMLDARLSRLENQLRDRLRLATHAIQTGQHRRLAVDYINPTQIRKLFQSLQERAAEFGCDLLITHHSDLFQIEVTLLFDGEDVHLLLHVPMVPSGSLLRLFKLHPFPLPFFSDHFLIPEVQHDILAVSSNNNRLSVQLSSVDLLGCHRMNQVFMCSKFGVLSKQFNQTCLGALFNQDFKSAQTICKFQVVPISEKVMQLKQNWFAAFLPEPATVPITCRNGTATELHLGRGSQRFHMSPGCTVHFNHHQITGDLSIKLPNEIIHYEWDWEPIQLVQLPEGQIDSHLMELRSFGIHRPSLTDLQYLSHRYSQTQPTNLAHIFHSVGNIILFLFLTGLLILICVRCRQYQKNKRKTPTASAPPDNSGDALVQHAASIIINQANLDAPIPRNRSQPSHAPGSYRYSQLEAAEREANTVSPHDVPRQQMLLESERQYLVDRLAQLDQQFIPPKNHEKDTLF